MISYLGGKFLKKENITPKSVWDGSSKSGTSGVLEV